jgi:hypothetical protein
LTEVVSPAEQRRGLRAAATEAMEKSDPVDQLDGFSVQLSIWLYRIEKSLGAPAADGGPMLALAERQPRAEHGPGRLEELLAIARRWLPWAAASTGSLALLAAAAWLLSRRLRYRLPELAVTQRLGGTHAAGIGAVLSFASTSQPPSVQRDQMPDYLQRL